MKISPKTLEPENRDAQQHGTQPQGAARFCKIVTFYEDFADAIRAVQNHEKIMQAFSNGRNVISTSWSFRMLGQPEMNSVILNDTSHASVIVVSNHGRYKLPERVASWVNMFMAANQGEKPVLVALHDEGLDTNGPDARLCKMLKEIASRTQTTFMCNRDIAEHSMQWAKAQPDDVHHEPAHSSPEAGRYGTVGHIRRWGIND